MRIDSHTHGRFAATTDSGGHTTPATENGPEITTGARADHTYRIARRNWQREQAQNLSPRQVGNPVRPCTSKALARHGPTPKNNRREPLLSLRFADTWAAEAAAANSQMLLGDLLHASEDGADGASRPACPETRGNGPLATSVSRTRRFLTFAVRCSQCRVRTSCAHRAGASRTNFVASSPATLP